MITAIILAGGLGSRLRGVLAERPKPMAMINGRPFLEYLMDYWTFRGVTKFVLCVSHKREIIIKHFGSRYSSVPIIYSVEDPPLDTGGALLLASIGQEDPFLVLNGDTFFEVPLAELLDFHLTKRSECTLSLFRPKHERFGAVRIESNGGVKSLGWQSSVPNTLANGGVYIFSPSALLNTGYSTGDSFSLERDLIPRLIAQEDKVFGAEYLGRFIDIGTPEDLENASDFFRKSS